MKNATPKEQKKTYTNLIIVTIIGFLFFLTISAITNKYSVTVIGDILFFTGLGVLGGYSLAKAVSIKIETTPVTSTTEPGK